jgi:hypothetical protein
MTPGQEDVPPFTITADLVHPQLGSTVGAPIKQQHP